MIDPREIFEEFAISGYQFYVGVPDSLLKHFCGYVSDFAEPNQHVVAANEGNAIAIAAGHYLATGKPSVVYMQNSGLGNAVNPLVSLAGAKVYKIPMIIMIGWRGEPGKKDEPQHEQQGLITEAQLDLMGVPYHVVDGSSDAKSVVKVIARLLVQTKSPVAILVREKTFKPYSYESRTGFSTGIAREKALSLLLPGLSGAIVVSTTGKISRELADLRRKAGEESRDFMSVGSMGHASSIAIGLALAKPSRRVVCLDGDGAALMHLGAMASIGKLKLRNLTHVLLNNASHESVGGQPTGAEMLDFDKISSGMGYQNFELAETEEGVLRSWNRLEDKRGPNLLEVRVMGSSRADLGRPNRSPQENARRFMDWIRD